MPKLRYEKLWYVWILQRDNVKKGTHENESLFYLKNYIYKLISFKRDITMSSEAGKYNMCYNEVSIDFLKYLKGENYGF